MLPLLYLHGLSGGDFVLAMEQFLGSAAGLSPATTTRLTVQWQADHAAFIDRDVSEADYVRVWAQNRQRPTGIRRSSTRRPGDAGGTAVRPPGERFMPIGKSRHLAELEDVGAAPYSAAHGFGGVAECGGSSCCAVTAVVCLRGDRPS